MAKRKRKPKSSTSAVMQLKVTLLGSEPQIWRRLLAASDMTLGDFHYLLQDAMGWTNSHLHQFVAGRKSYGNPEWDEMGDMEDEARVTLAEVLTKPKARIIYEYDFGDGWEHEVRREKVLPEPDDAVVPSCTDGQRACPPEDCGGVHGYEHLIEVLADPSHEEHEDMKEWIGGEFDPEAFDLEDTNQAIRTHHTRKMTEAAMKMYFEE